MKRAELSVGQRLAYLTPADYRDGRRPKLAVVKATEPYMRRSGYVPSGQSRYTSTYNGKGNGVYVNLERGTTLYPDVVRLGDLRGDYDEVMRGWEEDEKQRRAHRKAEEQAAGERRQRANTLSRRADRLGVDVYGWNESHQRVMIPADAFERLLSLAEAYAVEHSDPETGEFTPPGKE